MWECLLGRVECPRRRNAQGGQGEEEERGKERKYEDIAMKKVINNDAACILDEDRGPTERTAGGW